MPHAIYPIFSTLLEGTESMKSLFFAVLALCLFWTPAPADAIAWRLHYFRNRPRRVKVITHAVWRPFQSECRGGACRIR